MASTSVSLDTSSKRLSALFIIVNYESDDDARALAKRLTSLKGPVSVEAIVVDNSALSTAPLQPKSAEQPWAWVPLPNNPGYFGGARQGLDYFLTERSLADLVIISNADIHIDDDDFLDRLHAAQVSAVAEENTLVLAPRIISSLSSRDQNPYRSQRPSRWPYLTKYFIFRFYPTAILYRYLSILRARWHRARQTSGRETSEPPTRDPYKQFIFAPHGSFIVFFAEYFHRGGTLKNGLFLFAEELFVAQSVTRLGGRIVHDRSVEVVHREHVSTGALLSRRMASALAKAHLHGYRHYLKD